MSRPTDPAQILEHEINDLPHQKKPEKLTKKSLYKNYSREKKRIERPVKLFKRQIEIDKGQNAIFLCWLVNYRKENDATLFLKT